MKDYKITKATESDISQIQTMADIVFRKTYKDLLTPDQMEYMMQMMYSTDSLQEQFRSGHVFFIVRIDDQACAYMSIQPEAIAADGVQVFHLHKLYVLPSEQGCGLGRILINHAAGFARKSACGKPARIELNVNRDNPAVSFYKHLGLKILLQEDFPIGNGFYKTDYIMGMDV